MAHYYMHDGTYIIREGNCQDGYEDRLCPDGCFTVLGPSPVIGEPPTPRAKWNIKSGAWEDFPLAPAEQVVVDRYQAYPPVREQLDMLWHAMDDNQIPKVEPFYSALKAVKDQYPKPNVSS